MRSVSFEVAQISLEEAPVNSQGRKPLDLSTIQHKAPKGRHELRRRVSPLRGLRSTTTLFQGLAPLAIDCRPFRAAEMLVRTGTQGHALG